MRHFFAFFIPGAFVSIRGPFRKMRRLFAHERTPDSHKRTIDLWCNIYCIMKINHLVVQSTLAAEVHL
jgi:hypothetical protein